MILDEKEVDFLDTPFGTIHAVSLTNCPSMHSLYEANYDSKADRNGGLPDTGEEPSSRFPVDITSADLPSVFEDDSEDEGDGDGDGDDLENNPRIPSHLPPGLCCPPGKDILNRDGRSSFEPFIMRPKTTKLKDGFPLGFPPSDADPHPFIQRHVGETVWRTFLEGLQACACRASSILPSSALQPQTKGRSTFFRSVRSVVRSVSSTISGWQPEQGSLHDPAAFVDRWNKHYFQERGLEVILAKGPLRLNGNKTLLPPDCGLVEDCAGTYSTSRNGSTSRKNLLSLVHLPRSHSVSSPSARSEVAIGCNTSCHHLYPPTPPNYKPPAKRRAASWSHTIRSGISAWRSQPRPAYAKGRVLGVNPDERYRLIVIDRG